MDDKLKWSLVAARDASADGQFLYAVKTTRIYCRPTCGARLARQSNVEFFDTTIQAQAAGYRACKRCKPLLASYTPEADKIKKACDFLDSLPENAPLPGLERLAKEAGLTKYHFHRLFKRQTGLTPREYALTRRTDSSSETTNSSITTPAEPMFNDFQVPSILDDDMYGYIDFDAQLFDDMKPPSSQEARNIIVHYDIIDTTCGLLLLAFHDRRVCKIDFGNSQKELMSRLETDYSTLYYIHSSVALASAEDAAVFRQLTDDVISSIDLQTESISQLPILSFHDASAIT